MAADGGRGANEGTHQDAAYGAPRYRDQDPPTGPKLTSFEEDLDIFFKLNGLARDVSSENVPPQPTELISQKAAEESLNTGRKGSVIRVDKVFTPEEGAPPWEDGHYSLHHPMFRYHTAHINPEALNRIPEGPWKTGGVDPSLEKVEKERMNADFKMYDTLPLDKLSALRGLKRQWYSSELYGEMVDDVEKIRVAQEHSERSFSKKGADVFFLCEVFQWQQARGYEYPGQQYSYKQKLPFEPHQFSRKGSFEDLPYLPDEVIERESRRDFDTSFQPLVQELKELKELGAPEGDILKKILDDVRAFPYRKTANSFVAAFAGRTREQVRPKRGFFYELVTAFERPGLNCEGRAKAFCALLEAAGYNPETEIFLNWPKNHVQTLLKRKDGTYLAFEGNALRPFIQRFHHPTKGVCSLQEWKYTLYGVPTKKVIDSVDISQPDPIPDEDAENPETPVTSGALPEDAPWQESELKIAIAETLERASAVATNVAAGIFGLFAGKPDETERIQSAYPIFAPSPVSESASKPSSTLETAVQKERRLARAAQKEALRKLLEPKIIALRAAFKESRPAAIAMMGPACFFAYGSMFEQKGDHYQPPGEQEVTQAQQEWEEAARAVGNDLEVRLVDAQALDSQWEAQLERSALDAPYVYGEFDLIPDAYYGAITQQETTDGRVVQTIHVEDDVRVILPNAFRAMVERDVRAHLESGRSTPSLWIIEGDQLNIAATQKALSMMPRVGHSSVPMQGGESGQAAFSFSETWVLRNRQEVEQVQVDFIAVKTDKETHTLPWGARQEWEYRLAANETHDAERTLQGLATVSSHDLKKQFGTIDFYAPVNEIPLEEKRALDAQ